MHAKNTVLKAENKILFQDRYGVLQLAAVTTKPKPRKPSLLSKILHYLSQQFSRVCNEPMNGEDCSGSVFVCLDPYDFIHAISWKQRMQREEGDTKIEPLKKAVGS